MKRVEGYSNLCNKIWNGVGYVMFKLKAEPVHQPTSNERGGPTSGGALFDRWILQRLSHTAATVNAALK
jgi:valyl-tRNA synthetase